MINVEGIRGGSRSVRGSLFPALFNVGNSFIVCYSTRLALYQLYSYGSRAHFAFPLISHAEVTEGNNPRLHGLTTQEIRGILTFMVNSAL